MKKSYSKAEAFKVSFNANEQVAADACYLSSDTAKYDYDFSGCVEVDNKYATTSTNVGICMVSSDGVASAYFGESAGLDFDDYTAQYAS